MEYSDMKLSVSGGPSPLRNNYNLVGDDSPLIDFLLSLKPLLSSLLSSPVLKNPLALFLVGLLLRYLLGQLIGVDAALAITASLGLLTLVLVHTYGESEKTKVLSSARTSAADAARQVVSNGRLQRDPVLSSRSGSTNARGGGGGGGGPPLPPPGPFPASATATSAASLRHDDTIVTMKNGRVVEPLVGKGGAGGGGSAALMSGLDKFGTGVVPARRLSHKTKLYDGKRKKKSDKECKDEDKDETRVWTDGVE